MNLTIEQMAARDRFVNAMKAYKRLALLSAKPDVNRHMVFNQLTLAAMDCKALGVDEKYMFLQGQ